MRERNVQLMSEIARYRSRLIVYVRSWGAPLAREAEDVAHEIIERAIGRIDRFDGEHALSTWIYSLAGRYCADRFRQSGRRGRIIQLHAPELASKRPSRAPEEQVERAEARAAVNEYVASLDRTDRRIAFLRFFEELTLAEIAHAVQMPLGTVKYRIHVIKAGLREQLEAGEADQAQGGRR